MKTMLKIIKLHLKNKFNTKHNQLRSASSFGFLKMDVKQKLQNIVKLKKR